MKRYDLNQKMVNAAARDDLKKVRSCLEAGADINFRGEVGIELPDGTFVAFDGGQCDWTALMRAAMVGNTELAKFLLERGADVNMERNGKTALDYAEWAGKPQMQKLLKATGAKHGSEPFPKPKAPASIVL
jgi:ankyrin repeat protein